MTTAYSKNSKVSWEWGQGTASGSVMEVHKQSVSKTIKGTEVTRHGTGENPAYVIEQEDGDLVLKLHSELSSAE